MQLAVAWTTLGGKVISGAEGVGISGAVDCALRVSATDWIAEVCLL